MQLPPDLHRALTLAELGLALVTFLALRFVVAPYGRHARAGWGPTVPDRVGWLVMESPAILFFGWLYAQGPARGDAAPLALCALWMLHYGHRALIYPLRLGSTGKRMPALIALLGFLFNALNASVNAPWIAGLGRYPGGWLAEPRFLLGAALFAVGFALNLDADRRLLALRADGSGYRIPSGGPFGWVSCPNYLGELVEWTGWALATWSLAGLAFALYTAANLIPRALAHHAWYRERFPDYPADRKALIPFVL